MKKCHNICSSVHILTLFNTKKEILGVAYVDFTTFLRGSGGAPLYSYLNGMELAANINPLLQINLFLYFISFFFQIFLVAI